MAISWTKRLLGASVLVSAGLLAVAGLGRSKVAAHSMPFVPTADSVVLEQLPYRLGAGVTRGVANARATPDPALAARLARDDIEQYQKTSDPRYLGHAEARLAAFWDAALAPEPIVVLRAKIRASNHDFAGALADLDRLVMQAPDDAQVLFERATIFTVLGRYEEARRDCASLRRQVSELTSIGCLAAVRGATGDARRAAAELSVELNRKTHLTPGESAWAASLVGELWLRAGEVVQAEAALRQALAVAPQDSYTLATLADLWLDAGRPREVVELLAAFERSDALLLRLALAEQRLGSVQAERHAAQLAERFADAHLRGSTVHQREEARFELELRHDARRALTLSLANFRVQRETWDVRLVLESALAAHDAPAASEALTFALRCHNEDVELRRLVRALQGSP